MFTDLSTVHSRKAWFPIDVSSEFGRKTTSFRELHLPKAKSPIVLTVAGMFTESSISQSQKTRSSIDVSSESDGKTTSFRELQSLKALFPILLTVAGMITDSSISQVRKASFPIDASFDFDRKTTSFRAMQFPKAKSPIFSTVAGMFTEKEQAGRRGLDKDGRLRLEFPIFENGKRGDHTERIYKGIFDTAFAISRNFNGNGIQIEVLRKDEAIFTDKMKEFSFTKSDTQEECLPGCVILNGREKDMKGIGGGYNGSTVQPDNQFADHTPALPVSSVVIDNSRRPAPRASEVQFSTSDELFKFDSSVQIGPNVTISLEAIVAEIVSKAVYVIGVELGQDSEEFRKVKDVDDAINKLYGKRYRSKPMNDLVDMIIDPFKEILMCNTYREYVAKSAANQEQCDNAWDVIASLSRLNVYPRAIKAIVDMDVPGNMEDLHSEISTSPKWRLIANDHLLFTFALRNILSRLSFHTILTKAVCDTLHSMTEIAPSEGGRPYYWKTTTKSPFDAFAFVGFNRLLSPNNKVGVSLSSDIDYKLLFNSAAIGSRDSYDGKLTDADVIIFIEALNQKQLLIKDTKLDKEALMLLEVEAFTTKNLNSLAADLDAYPAEQNFLASIVYNNVLISGSPEVYENFKDLLQDYKNANSDTFLIAERTWTQYLGDTDKGSITVISNLEKIMNVIGEIAPHIVAFLGDENDPLRKAHIKLSKKNEVLLPWVASPKLFKKLLSSRVSKERDRAEGTVASLLAADVQVQSALKKLGVFGKLSYLDQLNRIAKVVAGLVDMIEPDMYEPSFAANCLKQIGGPLITENDWRYSLKYAGCRLSDFFDSVPYEEYKIWRPGRTENFYDSAKAIAVAINEFALKMQNNIYLLASNPDLSSLQTKPKLSHLQIDIRYSRVTNERFREMIDRPDVVKIRSQMGKLAYDLKGAKNAIIDKDQGSLVRKAITNVVKTHDALEDMLTNDEFPNSGDGRDFFLALFNLSLATAHYL